MRITGAGLIQQLQQPLQCVHCGAMVATGCAPLAGAPFMCSALDCPACLRARLGRKLEIAESGSVRDAVRAGVVPQGLHGKRRKRAAARELRRELAQLGQQRYAHKLTKLQREQWRSEQVPF